MGYSWKILRCPGPNESSTVILHNTYSQAHHFSSPNIILNHPFHSFKFRAHILTCSNKCDGLRERPGSVWVCKESIGDCFYSFPFPVFSELRRVDAEVTMDASPSVDQNGTSLPLGIVAGNLLVLGELRNRLGLRVVLHLVLRLILLCCVPSPIVLR